MLNSGEVNGGVIVLNMLIRPKKERHHELSMGTRVSGFWKCKI